MNLKLRLFFARNWNATAKVKEETAANENPNRAYVDLFQFQSSWQLLLKCAQYDGIQCEIRYLIAMWCLWLWTMIICCFLMMNYGSQKAKPKQGAEEMKDKEGREVLFLGYP